MTPQQTPGRLKRQRVIYHRIGDNSLPEWLGLLTNQVITCKLRPSMLA
jgi:hypothetical protein